MSPPAPPKKSVKLPEIHFDAPAGSYWLRLENAPRYLNLDGRNCKLHMMQGGFYIDTEDDFGLKSGDRVLLEAQTDRYVDYAGPLSGYPVGLVVTKDGKRILVTSQAAPLLVKPGKLKWIETYFAELFGPEQTHHVLLWLKFALQSLHKRDFRPGQMLVLCGESGCGKSLFQALVTAFLGGRASSPWRYMVGLTQFNSDLAETEHLYIEDQSEGLDLRTRRKLGDAIKQMVVVENWSVHAKGRKAITLAFYRRITMSVNDQPERVCVLPPMDDDLADKISLLHCTKAKSLSADKLENWANIERELPALRAMVQSMSVPKAMRDDRYGVASYHNPEILDMLSGTAPEVRLLEFIDQTVLQKCSEWSGSATELEQALTQSNFGFSVQKLLSFSSACGTYLARLKTKFPEQFQCVKNNGKTVWTIKK